MTKKDLIELLSVIEKDEEVVEIRAASNIPWRIVNLEKKTDKTIIRIN